MAPDETYDPIYRPAHYVGEAEPFDFIQARGLNFAEGNVIKYICRWRKKGGAQDLHKAKFYVEALLNEASKNEYLVERMSEDEIKVGGTD